MNAPTPVRAPISGVASTATRKGAGSVAAGEPADEAAELVGGGREPDCRGVCSSSRRRTWTCWKPRMPRPTTGEHGSSRAPSPEVVERVRCHSAQRRRGERRSTIGRLASPVVVTDPEDFRTRTAGDPGTGPDDPPAPAPAVVVTWSPTIPDGGSRRRSRASRPRTTQRLGPGDRHRERGRRRAPRPCGGGPARRPPAPPRHRSGLRAPPPTRCSTRCRARRSTCSATTTSASPPTPSASWSRRPSGRTPASSARRSCSGPTSAACCRWAWARTATASRSHYVERGELDQEQHDAVRDVFYVPGAVTLVRADLFAALGGFDRSMTVHGEDLDLCWRAHVAGARVVVAPAARVAHLEALGPAPADRRPAPPAAAPPPAGHAHVVHPGHPAPHHPDRVRAGADGGPPVGRPRSAPPRPGHRLGLGLERRATPARAVVVGASWRRSDRRRTATSGPSTAGAAPGSRRSSGPSSGATTPVAADFVSNLRASRATTSVVVWGLIVVFLLIGSRELLLGSGDIPAVGDFQTFLGPGPDAQPLDQRLPDRRTRLDRACADRIRHLRRPRGAVPRRRRGAPQGPHPRAVARRGRRPVAPHQARRLPAGPHRRHRRLRRSCPFRPTPWPRPGGAAWSPTPPSPGCSANWPRPAVSPPSATSAAAPGPASASVRSCTV